MIDRLDKGQHIKGTQKETKESRKDVRLVMPVLVKFLSTKSVAHSMFLQRSFFLPPLRGKNSLNSTGLMLMRTDSNNQVELVKVAGQLNY